MEARPLIPEYLYSLLVVSSTAEDLRDKTLASLYGKPADTVETYWKRLFDLTGIHDRGILVLTAVVLGWIPMPKLGWTPPPRERISDERYLTQDVDLPGSAMIH